MSWLPEQSRSNKYDPYHDEQDWQWAAGNWRFAELDVKQLPSAPDSEDDSDHQPEPLDGEAEIPPRHLRSECDYAHAEKSNAPADVRKESYSHPDKEEAPADGVQLFN